MESVSSSGLFILMELFLKPLGNLILLISVGLMGLGIYVMRRMINFDF